MPMPESCMSKVSFIKTGLHYEYFSRNVPTFFGTFLFFSESNNYCLDRVLRQGKCPKCNRRNTVTTFTALVKSHKGLKETKSLAKSCEKQMKKDLG